MLRIRSIIQRISIPSTIRKSPAVAICAIIPVPASCPVQLARLSNAIVARQYFKLDEDLIRMKENGQWSNAFQEKGYAALKKLSEQKKAETMPKARNILSGLLNLL